MRSISRPAKTSETVRAPDEWSRGEQRHRWPKTAIYRLHRQKRFYLHEYRGSASSALPAVGKIKKWRRKKKRWQWQSSGERATFQRPPGNRPAARIRAPDKPKILASCEPHGAKFQSGPGDATETAPPIGRRTGKKVSEESEPALRTDITGRCNRQT